MIFKWEMFKVDQSNWSKRMMNKIDQFWGSSDRIFLTNDFFIFFDVLNHLQILISSWTDRKILKITFNCITVTVIPFHQNLNKNSEYITFSYFLFLFLLFPTSTGVINLIKLFSDVKLLHIYNQAEIKSIFSPNLFFLKICICRVS